MAERLRAKLISSQKMNFFKFGSEMRELYGLSEKKKEKDGEIVMEYVGKVDLKDEAELEALKELGKEVGFQVVKMR